MKLLKTLDRAAGIVSAVTICVPMVLVAGGATSGLYAASEVATSLRERTYYKEAARILQVVTKTLATCTFATYKYGYFGAVSNPEGRRLAVRSGFEIIAITENIPAEQQEEFISKVVDLIDPIISKSALPSLEVQKAIFERVGALVQSYRPEFDIKTLFNVPQTVPAQA